ncbi:chaoptin-like [Photinus pyralis]|uniref:Uncharacterized protein n=1 Tax=Photinus pyralis TaxID=7054 RepID=A0A1Y1MBS7_PHOPY|nr:chaoptin-like [Photinus pyralis]
MFILRIIYTYVFVICVKCCVQETFDGTHLIGLRDVILKDEILDYNYFKKVPRSKVIPIMKITGCITATEEFQDAIAIEIRNETVPTLYEGAVQNLLSLHSLHIISSKVNRIKPRAFYNLPTLTILKLEDNGIELIQAQVFNNLMIKRLVLTFNRISHIESNAFDDMPRLESVRLDHNRLITLMGEWFQNCPKVTLLSFKFNQIASVPENAFRNVRGTLERVYLSNNNVREIHHAAFRGLTKLTDLSLLHNNITSIDNSTFLYLNNLKMIDISETDITCLHDSLLYTLRSDVLLWIDNIPLSDVCKELLEQWAIDNRNYLTFYHSLRSAKKGR